MTGLKLFFTVLLLILVVLMSGVTGIMCYICSSYLDMRCYDPFNTNTALRPRDCNHGLAYRAQKAIQGNFYHVMLTDGLNVGMNPLIPIVEASLPYHKHCHNCKPFGKRPRRFGSGDQEEGGDTTALHRTKRETGEIGEHEEGGNKTALHRANRDVKETGEQELRGARTAVDLSQNPHLGVVKGGDGIERIYEDDEEERENKNVTTTANPKWKTPERVEDNFKCFTMRLKGDGGKVEVFRGCLRLSREEEEECADYKNYNDKSKQMVTSCAACENMRGEYEDQDTAPPCNATPRRHAAAWLVVGAVTLFYRLVAS